MSRLIMLVSLRGDISQAAIANWQESSEALRESMDGMLKMLEGIDNGQ
jgi:hypothetical protein